MDQISRLVFDVVGRDKGGSKVLSDASVKADAAHRSMSNLSSALSGLGGPFDQVTSLASNFDSALDGSVGKVQKFGLGLTAAGVALIAFGAKDQQAQRQLQQSIQNTGSSYADYRGQIDDAIKAQERNAHTADDTQNALATLTTANQDVTKSLAEMNLVSDIAAAKHETLAEAATQLVQAQAGNTRAFKSFGIVLDGTGTKTEQIDRALKQLTDRLHGQASAAVDTTTGKLKVFGVQIEDDIARLSKYGPVLTIVGAGLTTVASVVQILAARKVAEAVATAAETRAEIGNAAARLRTAEAANVEASALQRATIAQSEGSVIGAGMAGNLGAGLTTRAIGGRLLGAGGYALGGYAAGQIIPGAPGTVASDALYGASIGSLVPGVGTALGAGAGAALGLVNVLTSSNSKSKLSTSDQALLGKFAASSGGQRDLKGLSGDAQYLAFVKNATPVTGHLADVVDRASKEDMKAALATGQYASSLIKQSTAATKAALSIDGQITALQASETVAASVGASQDSLSTSMHNLAQSIHDGSHALRGQSTDALNNRAALRDVVTQELAVIDAMRKHHVGADKVRAAALAMSRAIERNATDMGLNKTQVDNLLRSLGVLPPQIAQALGATSMLAEKTGEDVMNALAAGMAHAGPVAQQQAALEGSAIQKQLRLSAGLDAGGGNVAAFVPNPKADAAVKKYVQHISSVVSSYAPAVANAADKAAQTAADRIATTAATRAAAAAKARMAALKQEMLSEVQTVTQAFKQQQQALASYADLSNNAQRTDSLGAPFAALSTHAYLKSRAKTLEQFVHLLRRLDNLGASPALLAQFEQVGPDAIPAMQQEIARGRKGIRQDDRLEARIQRLAGQGAATVTGAEYGKQIAQEVQKLPDHLGRVLERRLRHLHLVVNVETTAKHHGKRVRAM